MRKVVWHLAHKTVNGLHLFCLVHNYTDAMFLFMANLIYFATQGGRSRDPLFADPCVKR